MFWSVAAYVQAQSQNQANAPKITRENIAMEMANMNRMITGGYPEKGASKSKILNATHLKIYEDKYNSYYSLPEIEKLTGFSREWFGKLMKVVGELRKCSTGIANAYVKLQLDKAEPMEKKYEDLQKAYKEIYEKPEKAKPAR